MVFYAFLSRLRVIYAQPRSWHYLKFAPLFIVKLIRLKINTLNNNFIQNHFEVAINFVP
jgi:hypothetical protein